MTLSQQPIKGTSDWLPAEFRIRKYIFDTWRSVCLRFGYDEYLTPIFEEAALYRAKSGEDVGGKELLTVVDRGDRELAIRPEMTPSVTRMTSRIYGSSPKPLRLFSIANFFRNEKPQRGRNREFWQLNYDLFGSSSPAADLEVLQLGMEIMRAFHPPSGAYSCRISSRKLIDWLLTSGAKIEGSVSAVEVARTMDKWAKLERPAFEKRLIDLGLGDESRRMVINFLECQSLEDLQKLSRELAETPAYRELAETISALSALGYKDEICFCAALIRGFDYYDGTIFEVFDNHPDNRRAMFGGGRYNGLAGLFGVETFPAVGAAPGDEAARLFLESWNILPTAQEGLSPLYYIPIVDEQYRQKYYQLAASLRAQGMRVRVGLERERIGKALDAANKNAAHFVAIIGENEASKSVYALKELSTGIQTEHKM